MSEPTCPNCGSEPFMDGQHEWICGTSVHCPRHHSTMCRPLAAEKLIRSLREELAEARDAERDHIVQYVLHLCYIDLAKAIRNNEHRSDT